MRKAVLATVTAGLLLGGTGAAMAAESGPGASAGDAECAAAAAPTMLTSAQAADAALRRAGDGRVQGVQLAEQGGRALYSVQFVRGNKVRTATVDAFSGEVSSIVNGGGQPGAGNGDGSAGAGDDGAEDATADSADDDDDAADDDDDDAANDDDDDDGAPIRQGVEGNK